MFLPVHSWSKRLAYLTSVFPKSKSDACLQAGFLPGRVLTPFSDFFFSVSPSWMVGCGRVRHMASSWACAETNTVAGCSCRLPSSYGFSDVLSHHLYAHFISCFFFFFLGWGCGAGKLWTCYRKKFFVVLLVTLDLSMVKWSWDFIRFCTSRVATSCYPFSTPCLFPSRLVWIPLQH